MLDTTLTLLTVGQKRAIGTPTIAPLLALSLSAGMHKPHQHPSTLLQLPHTLLGRCLTMAMLLLLLPMALVHMRTFLTYVSAEL